jgi:hypothetical protein
MNALRRRPSWLGRIVFAVVAVGAFLLVISPLRLALVFDVFGLLLSLAIMIWMVLPSNDPLLRRSYARGLLIWSGICFLPVWLFGGMTIYERAIGSALSSRAAGRIQWETGRNADDPAWVRGLPPVGDVRCVQRLNPDGACCLAHFRDGRTSEVHIFRSQSGRYAISKFTSPSYGRCRNPNFDPRAGSEDPRSRVFVPCEELRPAPDVPSSSDTVHGPGVVTTAAPPSRSKSKRTS